MLGIRLNVEDRMNTIEAIFVGGVFRPLGDVPIAENQRVRLTIESAPVGENSSWLAAVQQFHTEVIARHGVLPDSTQEIAADRRRHE